MEHKREGRRRWRRRQARRAAEASWSQEDGTLVVRGFGRIYSAPDLAIVGLRVETVNASLEDALGGAEEIISALVERLDALGVAREDIQTSSLNFETSHPEDRLGNVRTDITVFEVTHLLTLLLRDVSVVGQVLAGSTAAGVTSIDRLSWHAADIGALKARARELAMADARAHAEQLAAEIGVKLGAIVALEEEPFFPWGRPWMRPQRGRRHFDEDMDDELGGPPEPQVASGAPPVITVQGGQQRATVRVIVEWALAEDGE
ncbi:MAG: SIMPL domain-containing protein [Anaerolineae bacterium]|nr:SIMPL domain-containing protein [Anaerolineae bacterium]